MSGRWLSRDPIGETGHELLQWDYEEAEYELKLSLELALLKSDIFSQIARLKSRTIETEDQYDKLLEEVDLIIAKASDLEFLTEVLTESFFTAEQLYEGPSLFAFIGNDALNTIDVLGEAEHTKNKRPSTKNKHQKGQNRPKGGAKPGNKKGKPNFKPRSFPFFIPNWMIPGTESWCHMNGRGVA